MKTALALCGLLLLPSQLMAATPFKENVSSIIDWSVKKTWKIKAAPLDFAISFDKKKIFVLEKDNKVHLYSNSFNGDRIGTIPVAPSTVAFDIAPRGGMLYLVGSDKTYTAIKITFDKNGGSIADWSVQNTWKTDTRPLDIAQTFDKKFAFVLEKDNKVHVYSIAGKRRGTVPAAPDTVAIAIPSRKKTLHFVGRNKTYKAIRLSLF
ncbi:MAG: hypothetical protein D3924_03735 [Candidatus Electrothrix sp. AR4]|nr:hypothetical protein [Candidatus Electrothrix sp. AR4]